MPAANTDGNVNKLVTIFDAVLHQGPLKYSKVTVA